MPTHEDDGDPIPDPQRRARAREYARLRRRLLLLDLALTTGALGALLLSGASAALRDLAALAPGFYGQVAAYVAALAVGAGVLFLPLAYYAGFVLPHRFELSVQSLRGWLADYAKGLLVGLAQAVLVALPVYALLRHAPEWWWLWAALLLTLFTVVLANLAPVLIVPLFFKLRPLEDGPLRRRLVELAEHTGTPVRGVYVMDMSRRTRAANAALMGLGNTRRIVLGDTLWERFAPEEIEAVLAHELGHHVHNDLWRAIALDAALTFAACWLADRAARAALGPLEQVGVRGLDDVAALPLLLVVGGALFTLLLPLTNGFSRRREAAADRFAVRVTGNAPAWRGALRTLADQNLAEVDPPAWVEWLLYSHPSIRHRLEAAGEADPQRH
jgi:STE24 endopeptidase